MKSDTLRRWSFVHTWSSLICTLFILVTCLTGLPLLFRDEIDDFLYGNVDAQPVPPGTPVANLDKVIAAGLAHVPNRFVQFIIWDRDDPNVIVLGVGETRTSPSEHNQVVRLDAHTAAFLDAPNKRRRISNILLRVHSELFVGIYGSVLVGLMALLFVVAIVSGVVLYGPAMRKLDFGAVRKRRSKRIFWLDLHNLIGAALIAWTL